ncbi:hypothetical protein TNCV_3473681 [Trichonephila clavipes]|nr:hypothetical protein TNCV_3473681 [Trichonephila clavipes]
MDGCKYIVPSRQGGILNSRRAASPLVLLVEGEDRWEVPNPVLSLKIGVEPRKITCMVLKAKANYRHKILALSHDEFHGH